MSGTRAIELDLHLQREAQRTWASTPVRDRLAVLRRTRHAIARRARPLACTVDRPVPATLVSEVLPLAEACRFLEQNAAKALQPKRLGAAGRPVWLRGVHLEIHREPLGIVLVIGPANYPLFLPGVHAMQALAAGNAVVLKPGRCGWTAMHALAGCFEEAGLDMRLFRLLEEDPGEAIAAIHAGVHKVVLTGSSETGRSALALLAEQLVPSVMELSGHDPAIVLPGADLDLVTAALRFGTTLNAGETCIAPRRVIALAPVHAVLRERLADFEIGLPLTCAIDRAHAVRLANSSQFALGATVFGPERDARSIARELTAGVVVVNDMIVPTADPRLPFGGRGASGFGVTRGLEGLLEMTVVKALSVRRSRWLPHLQPPHPDDGPLFEGFISLLHGDTLRNRLRALSALVRAAMARRK